MPFYTFFLCRQDGSSTSFETRELCSDEAAAPAAEAALREHPSSAYVAVWEDERPVTTVHRWPPAPDLAALQVSAKSTDVED
jgi:hypothetical protein